MTLLTFEKFHETLSELCPFYDFANIVVVVVVVLLFYVHGKHLRSCQDGQLT